MKALQALRTKVVLFRLSVPLVAFASLFAQPSRNSAAPGRMIDVDGHRLWLLITGAGPKTVVFESGIGDTHQSWNKVVPEVSKYARVVLYDRAGAGGSEPGPEPRSWAQMAKELHGLLRNAGVPGPYILVGHSLGGGIVRAFCQLYRGDVAGLVFVDPICADVFQGLTPEQLEAVAAQQEAMLHTPGELAEWRFLKPEGFHNFPELRALGAPPDVPTFLLIAGRDRPPNWSKALLREYGPWIGGDSEGRLLLTPDSGHYIQNDQPELVIEAIRRVVFPSAMRILENTIRERGVTAAVAQYHDLEQQYPREYLPQRLLNTLGYAQLRRKQIEEAIALFKLNTEVFPNAFNAYDSLAEAYAAHGDRDLAIANYRRSLALNPGNTNASEALQKLELPKP